MSGEAVLAASAAFGAQRDTGSAIALTEERALTLCQLREVVAEVERRCVPEGWTSTNPAKRGERLTPETVTLYDLNEIFIKPATAARGCSYVELVASRPQRPRWFVSHWWGEPVCLFLRCLEQHATDHGLDSDTTYWVCAYANNQHDLLGAVTADPSESSFVKAIELAEGRVLTVLDEGGVSYTRIWCCLEIYLGLGHTYEVYTAMDHTRHPGRDSHITRAVGLTSGPCEADMNFANWQTHRQSHFPLGLLRRAFSIHVQDGQASVESDRKHILNFMAGRRGAELEAAVLEGGCEAYDQTNARLHGAYAAAGWRLLLEAGEDMAPMAERLAASGLRKLSLSFANCAGQIDVTSSRASRLLAASLPPTLRELRLDLGGNTGAAAAGMAVFERAVALGEQLEVLHMPTCELTGPIPEAIAQCTALRDLNLANNQLTGPIPGALGQCTALREVHLAGNQLTGPIPGALGECTALQQLLLYDNQLTGLIPAALGECTALVYLDLDRTQVTGPIPEALRRRQEAGELEISMKGCPERFEVS